MLKALKLRGGAVSVCGAWQTVLCRIEAERGHMLVWHRALTFTVALLTVPGSALAGTPLQELEAYHERLAEAPSNGQLRTEYKALVEEFQALGAAAREAIQTRLEDVSNPGFRRELAFMLGEIPGEASDRALLRLLCFDQSHMVRNTALFQLLHRLDLHGHFKTSRRKRKSASCTWNVPVAIRSLSPRGISRRARIRRT